MSQPAVESPMYGDLYESTLDANYRAWVTDAELDIYGGIVLRAFSALNPDEWYHEVWHPREWPQSQHWRRCTR